VVSGDGMLGIRWEKSYLLGRQTNAGSEKQSNKLQTNNF
jgi:hypothetical protein